MVHYLELYFREKGSVKWNAARGILGYSLENYADCELLNDLARENPSLEFNQNYLFLRNVDVTELGVYELDPLFAKPEIQEKFRFMNRDNLGWKSLEELTEDVFVPSLSSPPIQPEEDLPF